MLRRTREEEGEGRDEAICVDVSTYLVKTPSARGDEDIVDASSEDDEALLEELVVVVVVVMEVRDEG